MVHIGEVRAQVVVSYDRLGMPSWPDPHPGGTSPSNEEYSRVTAPERYRIVHARASAWVESLSAVSGIEAETMAPAALDEAGQMSDVTHAVRLSSTRSATLPLLLVTREVPLEEGSMVVLHICAARVSVVLEMLPDCGCDACDSGSDDLLEAIDDTISDFVSGPSVMLRGPGWYANWRPGGGGSGGDGDGGGPDHGQVMQLCRRLSAGEDVRLPEGSEAFVGGPWLG